jgi:outer membrane protein TolC
MSRGAVQWPALRRVAIFAVALAFASSPAAGGEVVTLAQCVDQALSAGPDMKLSAASLAMAQAQYVASTARNAIGLDGNAGLSLGSGQGNSVSGSLQAGLSLSAPLGTSVGLNASHSIAGTDPMGQSTSLKLNASSTLWDGYPGGSAVATARQADLSLQGKQISEDANRKSIVYQVKQAYYTLLSQQRQLAILQQTLVKRQEEMKKTQALYDAESANQIDLKQAQINERQAELDLARAQGNVELTREDLSALVGWPIEQTYSVAETDDLTVPDLDVAAAVKTALGQRSDMKQSALNLASGDISVALARAKGSLTVNANGSLSLTQAWQPVMDTSIGWSAGLQVSMPILDAGATDTAVKQAELQNETLAIQQDKLAASIATNVKGAIYSLKDLLARVDLAASGLELAQNQYDLAKLQFESGVSSNLDMLGASVSFTSAQVGLAKARSDAQLGVLALQNALGN